MSDYDNPRDFDKFGNPIPGDARPFDYAPAESNARAPYVLLGILVLVGIVGGALYFNGTLHSRHGANVATAPAPMSDVTAPAPGAAPLRTPGTGPTNATPAPMTTPAPAGPPAATGK